MQKNIIYKKTKILLPLMITCVFLTSAFLPFVQATDLEQVTGFDKGPSYTSVVPLKKVTFVNFDENSFLDDYAYLAAVPTAVFKHDNKLFSYPLLFYQDPYPVEEDKERSLNAYQGLDYFMQDWAEYCNKEFDQVTLINVEKDKIDTWGTAKNYVVIKGDDPYTIASDIALNDWSYSKNAVISVIEKEYKKPNIVTKGEATGTLPVADVKHKKLEVERPTVGIGATYTSFDVENIKDYKYISARLAWKDRNDYDLELYDDQLGMVSVSAEDFKSDYPYQEATASYIHNYGKWEVSVSAVPMKGPSRSMGKMESIYYESTTSNAKELSLRLNKKSLNVEVSIYPGAEVKIMPTPFGCRNVDFTLTWDNPNVKLGFTILDPVGTEIASSFSQNELTSGKFEETTNEAKIHVDRLGECRDGENYSICVFALDDISSPVDFNLEYSWQQNFSKTAGDDLSSACNGAVLASALNAPLLYTSSSDLPKSTIDVLYKLGVENIYLVNIGSHLSNEVKEKIENIAKIKNEYKNPREIYEGIRDITKHNDIILSTIDPWSYWRVTECKPSGDYNGALFIGPASYIAAHHGSPVILVDIHPRLSQAITYATDFWIKFASKRAIEPSSGNQYLSSKLAYSFFEDYGFGEIDKDEHGKVAKSAHQDHEVMITVAGQYEIGAPWDRAFTGAALPGRFWGSPVDSAYAICRNMFYPAMIFVNPAMHKVTLINGSKSTTGGLFSRLRNPRGVSLVITKKSGPEDFQYPVLQTYNTYQYRFNEKATKNYRNFLYTTADGITPYVQPSQDGSIDDGAAHGKKGAYYPDLSESEVIPFYCSKAGYSNVFSTNFKYVNENLNRGVLIWVDNCHGYYTNGGKISMWDPENPYIYEENPWRAYEPVMLKPGHLRTYLHWLPYYYYRLLRAIDVDVPILKKISSLKLIKYQFFPEVGCTENPDVAVQNTQLIYLNKLISPIRSLIYFHDLWGATGVLLYRDNIRHPFKTISQGLPFINWYDGDGKVTCSPPSGDDIAMRWYFGPEFDDVLKNIHSCGINAVSCFPAFTYLHMTWMRHGAAYVIIDPWSTTDWAAVWTQSLIKYFALGYTVGEAFERGMRMTGPEYPVEQWWWDVWENVELFGDPNLRVFVPSTEFSDKNHWEQKDTLPLTYDPSLNINGHTPFGATSYPHEQKPQNIWDTNLFLLLIIVVIVVILITALFIIKRKK